MTGMGTDVLALTCILCGAATGGGITMAVLHGDGNQPTSCAVEDVSMAPSIVVTRHGGSGATVIARPRIRVRTGDCVASLAEPVVVDLSRVREQVRERVRRMEVDERSIRSEMDAARTRLEAARAELERVRGQLGAPARPQIGSNQDGEIRIRVERVDRGGSGNGGG